MKKSGTITLKVLLIALIISPITPEISGQNTTTNPIEINFSHFGTKLHGWFYKTQGRSPFSTVILLHGSVGHDGDIFNLGESLSNIGFNVMTYNYPGFWRSEGNISHESALCSIQSAINFVKSDYSIQTFKADTSDIILAGYSYGAGMALLGSTMDSSIKKVIAIAPGDLSRVAEQLEKNPNARSSFEQMVDGILSNPAIGRGTTGKKYVEEMLENKDRYNLKRYSEELSKKELLFLAGWLDNEKSIENEVLPLFRDLQAKGAKNVEISAFMTNHSFLNVQKEFTETIINWLKE